MANYAKINKNDIANGPGVRVSVFFSGCEHYCKGCFNSEAWDFNYGKEFNYDTIDEILEAMKPSYIKGLTVLGFSPQIISYYYRFVNIVMRQKFVFIPFYLINNDFFIKFSFGDLQSF